MDFVQPIVVTLSDRETTINTVDEAQHALTELWPAERGPRHRDALDACLKVIDGHRSTIDAETAFREAAREAGILASR